MKEARITMAELALIAGTRAALGIGIGLLLSSRLTKQERKAAGWTLFLVGAITTIPLAIEVFGQPNSFRVTMSREGERSDRDFLSEARQRQSERVGVS
jgi:hypothetical protein